MSKYKEYIFRNSNELQNAFCDLRKSTVFKIFEDEIIYC